MDQVNLDFDRPAQHAPEVYRQIARRQFVLRRIVESAELFRYLDSGWMEKNWPVWDAFEAQANRVWAAGRKHFGARRIGEFIRYETALQEVDGDGLKVNDHIWPDFARLYVALNPEREDIFEFRGRSCTRPTPRKVNTWRAA